MLPPPEWFSLAEAIDYVADRCDVPVANARPSIERAIRGRQLFPVDASLRPIDAPERGTIDWSTERSTIDWPTGKMTYRSEGGFVVYTLGPMQLSRTELDEWMQHPHSPATITMKPGRNPETKGLVHAAAEPILANWNVDRSDRGAHKELVKRLAALPQFNGYESDTLKNYSRDALRVWRGKGKVVQIRGKQPP